MRVALSSMKALLTGWLIQRTRDAGAENGRHGSAAWVVRAQRRMQALTLRECKQRSGEGLWGPWQAKVCKSAQQRA